MHPEGGGLVPGIDLAGAYRFAQSAHRSGLLPNGLNADAALMIMLMGREYGLRPLHALMNSHIINGKWGMSASLMAELAGKVGIQVELKDTSDTSCTYYFKGQHIKRAKAFTYTIEMAKKAGLVKSSGNYITQPGAMLRARCLSQGIRAHFPGYMSGIYLTEELIEEVNPPSPVPDPELPPEPEPRELPAPSEILDAADIARELELVLPGEGDDDQAG